MPVDNEFVSLLLYADDIALLASCEDDLQKMLDCLDEWWTLLVNPHKNQVVHFRRSPSTPKSEVTFKCGVNHLQTVEKYRYLGRIFNEFLDITIRSKAVALSETPALGLINAKC